MNSMILKVLVLLGTAAVYAVNYFAAAGEINGRSPAYVSEKYPTDITPAGYAFTIWGLIYLGMLFFTVYQLLPREKSNPFLPKVRPLYLLVCAANIGWIFAWHYEFIFLSLLFMFALLGSLARICVLLRKTESSKDIFLLSVPFSLYFGWVTVAAVLNTAIALVYCGFTFTPLVSSILGAAAIVVVTVIGIVLRFKLDMLVYPIAIAWGLTAIGIEQSGDTIVGLASAFGMMALIFFALWGYVKDR